MQTETSDSSLTKREDTTELETSVALQMVDENPELAIATAREGSYGHFRAIQLSIESESFPRGLLPNVLEMFCYHLKVTEEENMAMTSGPDLAFECFIAIAQMRRRLNMESQNGNEAVLAPIIASNLTQIVRWCTYVHGRAISYVESEGLDEYSHKLLRLVTDVLLAIGDCGSGVSELLLTDEVLDMALNVWYHENMSPNNWPDSLHASAFLASYLLRRTCDPFSHIRMFMTRKSDLTAEGVADTALAKFRILFKQIQASVDDLSFDALADSAIIVNSFRSAGYDGITQTFRRSGAGKLFADAMLEISHQHFHPTEKSHPAFRAVSYCFFFLFDCCDAQASKPCMIQAVQNGLLRVVVWYAQYIDSSLGDDFAKRVKSLLSEVIPPFLISNEVLVPVIGAMRMISASELHHAVKRSGFEAEWRKFEKLVLEFAVCKRLYELEYKDKVPKREIEACHHCKKPKPRTSLQRCTGCRTVLYCDRNCQSIAWSNHKKACNWMDTERNFIGFLKCFVMIDVRRHINSVEAIESATPRTGRVLGPPVTTVDYTKVPHVIKTMPFEDYLRIGFDDPVQQLQMQMEGLEHQFGVHPEGAYQGETTVVHYISEDGNPKQRVLFLLLIKPTLRRPASNLHLNDGPAAIAVRSEARDQNGNVLEAERDDVDETLEDIYAKLHHGSKQILDVWKTLDIVLPLSE